MALRTGRRPSAPLGTTRTTGHGAASASALTLDRVSRSHRRAGRQFHALRDMSLDVPPGRFLAVMGRSGSGKTTFLQCAAGLDQPTSGTVRIGGTDLSGLSEAALTRLRRDRIGFVFQALNLVPSLSVQENVALPLLLRGTHPDDPGVRERSLDVLEAVGLADRADDSPLRMSGGQQQRVAVARALVTDPAVIFADEPTGALDPVTAREVLGLLRRAVDTSGHTVVMVTHDPQAAAWTDEVMFIEAGRCVARLERPAAETVAHRFAQLAER
ncbi:ABC transporter ATP-binding protein [Streptomyces albofaciens JCM 4342]|uniref:ABC transporter ATP-binding protein n=1 Tax=Streptomyces albofaciens TaxID=66866 RepID=UPI00123BB076|nr:ABC transporter ATP-binding protein [Streptomyces albofaciens]KAA6224538.1 ABC transporter ATP-binding protein [Streptomyces albofaciens JCM 4342]